MAQKQGQTQLGQKQLKQNKQKQQIDQQDSVSVEIDPRYRGLSCYNCDEPGHFVGICSKLKICFICATPGHYMNTCLEWQNLPLASYMGSVGKGLRFYHIDLPKMETTRWLNITNCGVVNVKKGVISLSELEKELSEIFYRN
jgi:hypothetical protein